jgi:hypothetical protein
MKTMCKLSGKAGVLLCGLAFTSTTVSAQANLPKVLKGLRTIERGLRISTRLALTPQCIA